MRTCARSWSWKRSTNSQKSVLQWLYRLNILAHLHLSFFVWQGKNGALRMRVESVLKQRDRMMEEAEAREHVLKAELEEVRVCVCVCVSVCLS